MNKLANMTAGVATQGCEWSSDSIAGVWLDVDLSCMVTWLTMHLMSCIHLMEYIGHTHWQDHVVYLVPTPLRKKCCSIARGDLVQYFII